MRTTNGIAILVSENSLIACRDVHDPYRKGRSWPDRESSESAQRRRAPVLLAY